MNDHKGRIDEPDNPACSVGADEPGKENEDQPQDKIVSEAVRQIHDQLELDSVASMVLEMRRERNIELRLRQQMAFLERGLRESQRLLRESCTHQKSSLSLLGAAGILDLSEVSDKAKHLVREYCLNPRYRAGLGVFLDLQQNDAERKEASIDDRRPETERVPACCRTAFALRPDEVRAGYVQWDPDRPFLIRRGKDGYCVHYDAEAQQCSIYDHRPMRCRAFRGETGVNTHGDRHSGSRCEQEKTTKNKGEQDNERTE